MAKKKKKENQEKVEQQKAQAAYPVDLEPTDEPNIQTEEIKVIIEALGIEQRRKLAQRMIRMASKLDVARRIAKSRYAPNKNLKRRAQRMARNIFRGRLAGEKGRNYKNLSPGDRIAIDKIIEKQNPRIRRLVDKLLPAVRKKESARIAKRKGGK